MIIRLADPYEDALAIVEGATDFMARVPFPGMMPDAEDIGEAVGRIVTLDGIEILVADHEGVIVAGIGFLYTPFLWNPAITIADELFWWAAPGAPFKAARMLFDTAIARAEERGARPVFRSLSNSPKGVERLYRKAGMQSIETTFVRV